MIQKFKKILFDWALLLKEGCQKISDFAYLLEKGPVGGQKCLKKLLTLYVDGPLAKQALDYMAKYNTLAAVTPELMARGHEMF